MRAARGRPSNRCLVHHPGFDLDVQPQRETLAQSTTDLIPRILALHPLRHRSVVDPRQLAGSQKASSPESVGRIRHSWAFQAVFQGFCHILPSRFFDGQIVPTPNVRFSWTTVHHKCGPMSPFRLRPRVGPRPAFPGVDARVKADGAAPFVEPEPRSLTTEYTNHFTHRYW